MANRVKSFRHALVRNFALPEGQGLEPRIATRLRAAQLAAATRHGWAMILANIANAAMIVLAVAGGPLRDRAFLWAAAMALYVAPLSIKMLRRLGTPPPQGVSLRGWRRSILNAGLLGGLWGAAPLLLHDVSAGERMIIVNVCVGMLCGGAFGLATIPLAALVYVGGLAGGLMIAFLMPARESAPWLAAPLLLGYSVILVAGACSHARSFADRVVAQARAELAARHDPLTGLPNRAAFDLAMAEAFDRWKRYGERFALLCIDLDDFKAVNDRWGHQAGDQLLSQAANRLLDSVERYCTVARLGGDEFAIIARGVFDKTAASVLAADVESRMSAAFELDTGTAFCGASIGVAMAPVDGDSAETLLKAADTGLYASKRERRGASPVTAAPEASAARRRRELTQDLKSAIARNEIFLQYQPVQTLRGGRLEGFEALARWRHPRLGPIPPTEFIEIAEKIGLIHELGEWILNEACREAASWPDDLHIAVNVSAEQLCDASFDGVIDSALRISGLPARRLQIEITESAALVAVEEPIRALRRLRDRGVEIVLDDFGTGFSSFDHIRRLPVSRVKIDRSFVGDLPQGRESGAIVKAVVSLAQALDFPITAEGVETEAQRAFLEKAGCTSGQGYLIARPLDASDARARIQTFAQIARSAA